MTLRRMVFPLALLGAGTSTHQPPSAQAVLAVVGASFAISVDDLDASVRWYTDKLGLHRVGDVQTLGRTTVIVLEGRGLLVELLHSDDAVPFSTPKSGNANRELVHGIFKVGIVVDDLDAAMSALRARNVAIAYGPFPAKGSQRANVIIRDNSGTLIQILAR